MKRLFLLLLSLIGLFSCNKTNTINQPISDGTYKGTFQRQVSGNGQISTITINFNSGIWTGQSQIAKYPALCSGSYKTNSDSEIIFQNACVWTAEFDWTLILSDTFKIKTVGDSLELVKNNNNNSIDIYKLRKE